MCVDSRCSSHTQVGQTPVRNSVRSCAPLNQLDVPSALPLISVLFNLVGTLTVTGHQLVMLNTPQLWVFECRCEQVATRCANVCVRGTAKLRGSTCVQQVVLAVGGRILL